MQETKKIELDKIYAEISHLYSKAQDIQNEMGKEELSSNRKEYVGKCYMRKDDVYCTLIKCNGVTHPRILSVTEIDYYIGIGSHLAISFDKAITINAVNNIPEPDGIQFIPEDKKFHEITQEEFDDELEKIFDMIRGKIYNRI